ncbi:MBL fold metallo-hydrolase [Kribbella sp. DT2]|uniref:MBL fold metallo-hydrolase n=1 Tax=Kribbella sp. DT2 TaxID=3393427 RepID=UPI003CF106A4
MRVHSLNCGTMASAGAGEPPAVCHCLLIETDADGLVLVDTGLGTVNLKDPAGSLGEDFLGWARPVLRSEETAVHQVEQLGFAASDVRHVVVTHLHRDHCGGLPDFPDASVHLHAAEHEAALPGEGIYLNAAYAHGPKWVTYAGLAGDEWMGFAGVRALDGLPPEILMVPLLGHTPGHVGVAVQSEDGWLLHAGDAYFHRNELHDAGEWPEGLDQLQARAETDRTQRLANRDRLREAVRRPDGPVVFSAHDPVEFAGRP